LAEGRQESRGKGAFRRKRRFCQGRSFEKTSVNHQPNGAESSSGETLWFHPPRAKQKQAGTTRNARIDNAHPTLPTEDPESAGGGELALEFEAVTKGDVYIEQGGGKMVKKRGTQGVQTWHARICGAKKLLGGDQDRLLIRYQLPPNL